jgi:hypothetical protein
VLLRYFGDDLGPDFQDSVAAGLVRGLLPGLEPWSA